MCGFEHPNPTGRLFQRLNSGSSGTPVLSMSRAHTSSRPSTSSPLAHLVRLAKLSREGPCCPDSKVALEQPRQRMFSEKIHQPAYFDASNVPTSLNGQARGSIFDFGPDSRYGIGIHRHVQKFEKVESLAEQDAESGASVNKSLSSYFDIKFGPLRSVEVHRPIGYSALQPTSPLSNRTQDDWPRS